MSAIASLSSRRLSHRNLPRPAVNSSAPKYFLRFQTPIAKCALGKFHDIPPVHERYALAPVLNRVITLLSVAHCLNNDRFDRFPHVILLRRTIFQNVLAFFCAETVLSNFGILFAENSESFSASGVPMAISIGIMSSVFSRKISHFFRMFDGPGDAFEMLGGRRQTKRSATATATLSRIPHPGRGQRSYDSDQMLTECFYRRPTIRQFCPSLFDRRKLRTTRFSSCRHMPFRLPHQHAHSRQISGPCPVSANERNDRLIRHIHLSVLVIFRRGRATSL